MGNLLYGPYDVEGVRVLEMGTVTLEDPFGHVWSIATHVEDVPPAEMKRRSEAMMKRKA